MEESRPPLAVVTKQCRAAFQGVGDSERYPVLLYIEISLRVKIATLVVLSAPPQLGDNCSSLLREV